MDVWDIFETVGKGLEQVGRPLGTLTSNRTFWVVVIVVGLLFAGYELIFQLKVSPLLLLIFIALGYGLIKLGAWGYEWIMSKQ